MATQPVTIQEAIAYINNRHKFNVPYAFDRIDAYPIEKYSIFPSLDEAKKYASGQGGYEWLAYEGQLISVGTSEGQDVYVIDSKCENNLRKLNAVEMDSIVEQVKQDLTPEDIGAASEDHTHDISGVSGLSEALSGKASETHGHGIQDIEGLSEALEERTNVGVDDVEGLSEALSQKAGTSHKHDVADITYLQTALNQKANASHEHQISQITGLETRLSNIERSSGGGGEGGTFLAYTVNGLSPDASGNFQVGLGTGEGQIDAAPTQHTHEIQDVNGLQSALDGKSDTNHTHTMVTGINVNDSTVTGDVKLVGERNVEVTQDGNNINIGITPYTSDTTQTIRDSGPSGASYKVFVGTQSEWDEFKQGISDGEHYIVFLRS